MSGATNSADHSTTDAVASATVEDVVMLPLAITRIDSTSGCAAGLTEEGRWIRPEPVLLDDVAGEDPYYVYGRPVHCRIGPSESLDRRPEDRALLERLTTPDVVTNWQGAALETWLAAHCDAAASASFACGRSVGLIRAQLDRLAVFPSTRGRHLVKLAFVDEQGERNEWIVPCLPFSTFAIATLRDEGKPEEVAQHMIRCLRDTKVFLTLVLTKPRTNSLGTIRGCQPLVSGVHTFPSYRDIFF